MLVKSRKVRDTTQSSKMANGIYGKLRIFIRPVQKRNGTCVDFIFTQFVIYTLIILKVILKLLRFVYFLAVSKIQLSQFSLFLGYFTLFGNLPPA